MCNKLGLKKKTYIYLNYKKATDTAEKRREYINYCKQHHHPHYEPGATRIIKNKYNRQLYNYLFSIDGRINKRNKSKMKFGRKLLTYLIRTNEYNDGYWEYYKYFK